MRDLNRPIPHLVVSISGHGFGHLAQTAPILNRLQQLLPPLRITLRSALPPLLLRSRIHAPFELLPSKGDLGMAMSSAIDVLAAESRAAYRRFHADWDARVADEARLLRELETDLVFSNVGYLPLAGAQRGESPTSRCVRSTGSTSTAITAARTGSARRCSPATPVPMPSCARHRA